MSTNHPVIASFNFEDEGQSAVKLLAFSLELRRLLKENHHLIAYIPSQIYEEVPATSFQELIFDTLSPLYVDLDKRLKLRVHNLPAFEIKLAQ